MAGVSNWGAHALVAALSILFKQDLLYSTETEERLLRAIVGIGAVDGMTKQNTLTVDGLGIKDNTKVLKNLRTVVAECVMPQSL